MNQKLALLLLSAGVTLDTLNHRDLYTRREARARLGKVYPTAIVIAENAQLPKMSVPRHIDGVFVEYPTFASLTAASFSQAAHGAAHWRVVSLANLDKIILVENAVISEPTSGAAQIPVIQVSPFGTQISEPQATIEGETTHELPQMELRSVEDIADEPQSIAQTETAAAIASNGELFAVETPYPTEGDSGLVQAAKDTKKGKTPKSV
jgi:hypothetical protein